MTTGSCGAWEAFARGVDAAVTPANVEAFDAIVSAAERAWPALAIDRVRFARFLGDQVQGAPEPLVALEQLHVGDLLLVFALEERVSGVDEALEVVLRPVAARVHGSVRTGLSLEELRQELRVFFFVDREERSARVRQFRGRSSLARWLHVAGTRAALNLVRDRPRELAFEDAFFLAQPDLRTPEAQLLDATYGGPMRTAVGRALARLDERQQALLWFSLVDGRPAEQIAKVYGVHRTTAMRWIERACSELRRALEGELAMSEGLRVSELSSIVRTILSPP